jgi:hypothetical protein
MAYPTLPKEAQRELDDIARKYTIFIHTQQYDSALSTIEDFYNRMLKLQQKYNQRFHKGYPIHNIGYTLYLQHKPQEAIKYFILAYIEDLLSADRPEEADATAAGQTLRLGYKYSPELLELLKRKVAEFKERGRAPLKPEEVVRELEESKTGYQDIQGRVTIVKREAPLRPFTVFNKEWQKRVFIGGSIGLEFIIDKIAEIVGELGYEPIVCHQSETPEEMETNIRQKCLVLLHCCKYAIFDVAEHRGQLVEIDRAPEYGVLTLVVCPDTKEKEVTEMLKSLVNRQQIKSNSYRKFPEDVKAIIREFLPQKSFGGSS